MNQHQATRNLVRLSQGASEYHPLSPIPISKFEKKTLAQTSSHFQALRGLEMQQTGRNMKLQTK